LRFDCNLAPALHEFLTTIEPFVLQRMEPAYMVSNMELAFRALLEARDWLAPECQQMIPDQFAQYLLYRTLDSSLSVMAMVVPPGHATPVHDHLSWGLVGVYQGMQNETVYRWLDDGGVPGRARLRIEAENQLDRFDVTRLVPPDGDIHSIRTLSVEPSISIHVLGNDIGCRWRHSYPLDGTVIDFRSGYINASCDD